MTCTTGARRSIRRRSLPAALAASLVLGATLASCGNGDDGHDLAGLCAVAGGRDLAGILEQHLDEGIPATVMVPGGEFDASTLAAMSRSFANIIEEQSPEVARADAESYANALRAALDGDPISAEQRQEAVAAGNRLDRLLSDECPDT